MPRPESTYRDADNWINEVVSNSTTQDDKEWHSWDCNSMTEPEGLVHVVLRSGQDLQYYLAQRLRWAQNEKDDDIVSYRYLTDEELQHFADGIRPSAELAEKASKFINEFYQELYDVNEQLNKNGLTSGTLSMVMNFSLNCSLTESGTLANMSGTDMRRIANELMMQAMK